MLKCKFEEIIITKKIENWFELDFKDFQKELQKQKIKISLSEESDCIEFFVQQSKSFSNVLNSKKSQENEIDQMVYQFYGLIDDGIANVENSIK